MVFGSIVFLGLVWTSLTPWDGKKKPRCVQERGGLFCNGEIDLGLAVVGTNKDSNSLNCNNNFMINRGMHHLR